MADQGGPPSPPPNRRRASIVDMFNPRSHSTSAAMSSSPPSAAVPATPAPQHRRGASITSLGLTTNPSNQSSPFSAFARQRRASIATSSASGSPDFRNSFGDEPAVIEEDDQTRATIQPPASPSFARRVSFGAQALRDVKGGGSPSASGGGRRPSSSLFTLDENSEHATPSRKVASGTAKTAGKSRGLSLRSFPCMHFATTPASHPPDSTEHHTNIAQGKDSIGQRPSVTGPDVLRPSHPATHLLLILRALGRPASPTQSPQRRSPSQSNP